jgi:hypothetical protein
MGLQAARRHHAAQLAGRTQLRPLTTAYTLSPDTASDGGQGHRGCARGLPLLKLKLGVWATIGACAKGAACPKALIADANEA